MHLSICRVLLKSGTAFLKLNIGCHMKEKKSKKSKKIKRKRGFLLGVCSSLGEYYGFDPTPLRLLFLLLNYVGAPMVIIYFVIYAFFTEAPDDNSNG